MRPDRDIARSAEDEQPFSALAFKIMNDPFVGSLTFTRISRVPFKMTRC